MVGINLYPWREERARYEAKKIKQIWVGSVAVCSVMLIGIHVVLSLKLQPLVEQEGSLKESLQRYEIEQKQVDAVIMQAPDSKDSIDLHALLNLTSQVGEHGICLNSIERSKASILFVGEAPSEMALTQFLKQWKTAELFSEIRIERFHRNEVYSPIQFELRASLKTSQKGSV